MNTKKIATIAGFALLMTALPLRAQGGCVDSPEDPTLVLALLAGAGAFVVNARRLFGRKQH
jgi:XrtJ-associated TM-motif-TM protein